MIALEYQSNGTHQFETHDSLYRYFKYVKAATRPRLSRRLCGAGLLQYSRPDARPIITIAEYKPGR